MRKMKRLCVVMLVLLMGVLPMVKTEKKHFEGNQLPEVVLEVEMDTNFEADDFVYNARLSKEFSDDVGMPEWIGW